MSNTDTTIAADFIVPLCMNGLQGRMLYMPGPAHKKREILVVYGHHSTLERWWGLIQELHKYGTVTMPDLPGFGGMQSLYKIGEKPDLDTMADYLAAFIKLRYSRKRLSIVGMSYGFLVVTRMLLRYPELAKKVDILSSAVGFSHYQDFKMSPLQLKGSRVLATFLMWRPVTVFFRNVCLHPMAIRAVYSKTPNAKHKFANLTPEKHREIMDFEVHLWRTNDVRTHWATMRSMLYVDNCTGQVNLPVYNMSSKNDQYFDNRLIEQHMRVIFSDYYGDIMDLKAHAPSVMATAAEAAPLLSRRLRKALGRKAA